VLRHANALFGILFILLSYRAFRRVIRDPLMVMGATVATALHPLTLYLSSHVTNDVLAAVWVALVFYCLSHVIPGGGKRELAWWAGVGAAAALGMLTKYTSVVAFAAALAVIVLQRRQFARPLVGAAARLGILGAALLIFDGWWLVRNLLIYHELLPVQHHRPIFEKGLGQALLLPDVALPMILGLGWEFVITYFGPLWLFQRVDGYFLFWTALIWIPLLLWPISGWFRNRRRGAELLASREERVLYVAALAAFVANLLGVVNTVLFHQSTMMFFVGRFMLCSLPGTMLLMCTGVGRHTRLPVPHRAGVIAFCCVVAAQNLWIIPGIWLLYRS
jgi:4-amino-4-deoxy-L-arabinose transferase-like glycosyltransferase